MIGEAALCAKMNYDRKEVTIYYFFQKKQEWNFVKMLEKSHVILKNIQEFLHSHGFNQHIISES